MAYWSGRTRGKRRRFKPFWIDEEKVEAAVAVEEQGQPIGIILASATGMCVEGMRLLDGALVLEVQRGRPVKQVRVSEGDSFDMERTALRLRHEFD
ncbi:MAG: hypothetical protein OXF79_02765 [Chloroflexi bacterium]|nr:hypothetical protein [Chloroflexota bacterium]